MGLEVWGQPFVCSTLKEQSLLQTIMRRHQVRIQLASSVSPLDVLSIINYLNVFGAGNVPAGSPPPYLDVNGDNQISPLDGLEVINFLNRAGSGEGEDASRQVGNVPSKSQLIDAVFMQYGQDFLTDYEFPGIRGNRLRRSSEIH